MVRLLLVLMSFASVAQSEPLLKSHTFSPGGRISSSEMNELFDQLFTEANSKEERMTLFENKIQTIESRFPAIELKFSEIESKLTTVEVKVIDAEAKAVAADTKAAAADAKVNQWDGRSTGLSPATGRASLGLGDASVYNVGTTANAVVKLDSSARLPAVDGSQLTNLPDVSKKATYRFAIFSTADSTNWSMTNYPLLFGGVSPSGWSDQNALASHISPDKEMQRTLLTQKGYAKGNALVVADTYLSYGIQNGKIAVVLFRVQNTTAASILWKPYFYFSANSSMGEVASIALNGVHQWTAQGSGSAQIGISIPPNRTSTVIFVSAGGPSIQVATNIYNRSLQLGFINNSLTLPTGLKYLDDLDTAVGGYEQ
jgi:hypothetical protein